MKLIQWLLFDILKGVVSAEALSTALISLVATHQNINTVLVFAVLMSCEKRNHQNEKFD